jgi:lipid-binding SYLF domain-containing protein
MPKNVRYTILVSMIIFLISFVQSAIADSKEDKQKKQAAVVKMKDETLADLYKQKPETKAEVAKSAGYAVFDSTGIHLLLLATSRGNGVAIDNKTQSPVYMKMTTVGAGPGLGAKDYRVIFIFSDKTAFNKFIEGGWGATGEADAAAKTNKEGGSASGGASSKEGTSIYTITKKGVALQATLGGTKFKKDDDLN